MRFVCKRCPQRSHFLVPKVSADTRLNCTLTLICYSSNYSQVFIESRYILSLGVKHQKVLPLTFFPSETIICVVVKKIWELGALGQRNRGPYISFPMDIQVRENPMIFRQLSVSQSWFLASAALAKPKTLRVIKWREHSPSTSACGQGSGAGVDALRRLSLVFPGSLPCPIKYLLRALRSSHSSP